MKVKILTDHLFTNNFSDYMWTVNISGQSSFQLS